MMGRMATGTKRGNHALWLGPILAFAGTVSYFVYFARFPALRDLPWVNLPVVLAGLALSAYGFVRALSRGTRWWVRVAASLGLALSLLVGGFLPVYVFGLSYALPAATATSAALDAAPDFELPDSTGTLHRLSDLRGTRVVIVFYRGHW
jgi:hypothetical protein